MKSVGRGGGHRPVARLFERPGGVELVCRTTFMQRSKNHTKNLVKILDEVE